MDNRKLLIETALQLFKEKGYDAVSISEIRKAAGLSNGTYYHYFKSKEELLKAICEEKILISDIGAEMDMEEKLKNPYSFFREFYLTVAEILENIGYEIIFPMHQLYYNNSLRAELRHSPLYEFGFGELIKFIEAGQKKGIFDTSVSPEKAANVIAIFIRGIIYEWVFSKGTINLTYMLEEYFFPQIKLYLENGK